ncbi:hypothetical protein [Bifidobacterium longum]|uniref:hypothetical protein n=1 Tax=Bifidobacterium longum TaxID=216816 RepID=UPI00374F49C8
MDISTATTLASGLVALIVPAFVQAFKKYIPSGYVGLVSLVASILFGTIAIAATGGFDGTHAWASCSQAWWVWRRPCTRSSTRRSTAS